MELIMMLVMATRIRVMMGIAMFFMGTNAIVMIMELIMRGHDVW